MASTAATPCLLNQLTGWSNLIRAAKQAQQGKRHQGIVAAFELERERNLLLLQDELRSRTYAPGAYRAFYVREPKRRLISAAPGGRKGDILLFVVLDSVTEYWYDP